MCVVWCDCNKKVLGVEFGFFVYLVCFNTVSNSTDMWWGLHVTRLINGAANSLEKKECSKSGGKSRSIFSESVNLISSKLLLFKGSVPVESLFGLPNIIIVLFAVELGLALEIPTRIILHHGHIPSHLINGMLSAIFMDTERLWIWLLRRDCGLFWLILLNELGRVGSLLRRLGELEFFRHGNV